MTNEVIIPVPAGASSLTFLPNEEDEFLLQIRAVISGTPFAYGPALKVTASDIPLPPPPPEIEAITLDPTGAICIRASHFDPNDPAFELQSTTDLKSGSWETAQFTHITVEGSEAIDLCVQVIAGTKRHYFRIVFPQP